MKATKVHLMYKGKPACIWFDSETCSDFSIFLRLVRAAFSLQEETVHIYQRIGDYKWRINSFAEIIEGQFYSVEIGEISFNIETMDQFYDALATVKAIEHEDLDRVKEAFKNVQILDLVDLNVHFSDSVMRGLGVDDLLVRNRISSLVVDMRNAFSRRNEL
jgi:hypothetical protein